MEVRGGVADVTVVSCVWGGYHQYVEQWIESIRATDPQPAAVILSSDRQVEVEGVRVIVSENRGVHPENARWDECTELAETGWVQVLGIDDELMPDVFLDLPSPDEADVFQVGYFSERFIPSHMPPEFDAAGLLAMSHNPTVYASPFTKRIWEKVGGHRDLAFSDMAMFRDFARAGARFAHSHRYGIRYNWHHETSLSGAYQSNLEHHLEAARRPA